VATRTNQIILDNTLRKLCEIEFFEQGFTVANPVFNLFDKLQGKNLLENNMKKIPKQEKSMVNSLLLSEIGGIGYNVLERKKGHKLATE